MCSTQLLVRSLVGLFLPLFCVVDLGTSNGLMPAAGELMTLSILLIMPGVERAVQVIGDDLCLLVLRPRGSVVLQGSHIMNSSCRNSMKHSTCLHKWWEILKRLIFGVKWSIPMAPAEKASLLGCQFDSKQQDVLIMR